MVPRFREADDRFRETDERYRVMSLARRMGPGVSHEDGTTRVDVLTAAR
jgi:hypothetical protein